jgi:ferrochelatase
MAKYGVVLMNLGSPDSPNVPDVKTYLREFLMDEKVIDIPYLIRSLLVKGIIVPFRSPKSAHAYQSIWTEKGSPLIVNTINLKDAMSTQTDMPIEICMRYGNPHPKVAFDQLTKDHSDLEEVFLFPLYPHYAMSSYETAVEYAKEVYQNQKYRFKLTVIPPYYNHPSYINALSQSIAPYLNNEYDKIIFSYHGVPERHILKGDVTCNNCLKTKDCCEVFSDAHPYCYRHQTFETTKLVSQALALPKEKFEQTFQSRLGRDKWLTPYTAARLQELPKEGNKKILVVCPAFVSDCLETLEEIAEEGKELFLSAGGESYTMIPCLNSDQQWVNTIFTLINDSKS